MSKELPGQPPSEISQDFASFLSYDGKIFSFILEADPNSRRNTRVLSAVDAVEELVRQGAETKKNPILHARYLEQLEELRQAIDNLRSSTVLR